MMVRSQESVHKEDSERDGAIALNSDVLLYYCLSVLK